MELERVSYYAKLMKRDGVSPAIDLKSHSAVAAKKAAEYLVEEGMRLGIDIRPTRCMMDKITKGLWFISLQVRVKGGAADQGAQQERMFKLAQVLNLAYSGCAGIELVNYGIKVELRDVLLAIAENNPCIKVDAVVYKGRQGKDLIPVIENPEPKKEAEISLTVEQSQGWSDYYSSRVNRAPKKFNPGMSLAVSNTLKPLGIVLPIKDRKIPEEDSTFGAGR